MIKIHFDNGDVLNADISYDEFYSQSKYMANFVKDTTRHVYITFDDKYLIDLCKVPCVEKVVNENG